jgi:hypothetical protein
MRQAGEECAAHAAEKSPAPARDEIAALFLADEAKLISTLRAKAAVAPDDRPAVAQLAARLVGQREPPATNTAASTPSCTNMASPPRRASS